VIAFTINRCRSFLVRDQESKDKLSAWGVRIPVIASYDPAVFDVAKPATDELVAKFAAAQGISPEFLDNFAGFGLRRWFHYSQSGWLPASMRFWQKQTVQSNPQLDLYLDNLAKLADRVIETQNLNLVFFPMHVSASENDPEFARQVVARMKHGERTTVIDGDTISPDEYLSLIGKAKLFVASRLHSAILATVANVPALCLYYVDKGRLFFEQVGMQRYSRDIQAMLTDGIVDQLIADISALVAESDTVKSQQREALTRMRGQIRQDFVAALQAGKAPRA
jgi:polysaccharide pyruvyl transferase WcaK-like protein